MDLNLTPTEQKDLNVVFQCLTQPIQIDYEQMRIMLGSESLGSIKSRWSTLKSKILKGGEVSSKGRGQGKKRKAGDAGQEDDRVDSASPAPKQKPKQEGGRKSKAQKLADAQGDDDDTLESSIPPRPITRKRKPKAQAPKQTAAAANIEAEVPAEKDPFAPATFVPLNKSQSPKKVRFSSNAADEEDDDDEDDLFARIFGPVRKSGATEKLEEARNDDGADDDKASGLSPRAKALIRKTAALTYDAAAVAAEDGDGDDIVVNPRGLAAKGKEVDGEGGGAGEGEYWGGPKAQRAKTGGGEVGKELAAAKGAPVRVSTGGDISGGSMDDGAGGATEATESEVQVKQEVDDEEIDDSFLREFEEAAAGRGT